MEKIAIFTADLAKGTQRQPGLLCVYTVDKVFEWRFITTQEKTDQQMQQMITLVTMNKQNSFDLTSDQGSIILNLYKIITKNSSVIFGERIEFSSINKEDIILHQKVDAELSTIIPNLAQLKLTDLDYTAEPITLQQYIENNFTVEATVEDFKIDCSIASFAARKDDTDYNLFWNTDKLTEEEKAVARPELNLDILKSNWNRETYHIFNKIMTSKYPEKRYTAVALHGNPASGKTEMVKAWCAFNNVPLIYIPCDSRMTVDRILTQVGPVNVNGKAELVKTESILFKCLKYNLPVVVFLDESTLLDTAQTNGLAPIISEGNFKDGPNLYHNDFTVKWVFAYNPNTTNAKSFDGKFYDRLNFIQVEDVSDSDRKAYRANKLLSDMIPSKGGDLDKIKKEMDKRVAQTPECAEKAAMAFKILKNCVPNTSQAALQWGSNQLFLDETSQNDNNTDFKVKYLGEVTLDTASKIKNSSNKIYDFIQKVNIELMNQTKGMDTKNPDRSAYFYIADRATDVFADYIYSYRDVEKATYRMVMDLVPGGFTVRGQAIPQNALTDPTPKIIAESVCQRLGGVINDLNNYLFMNVTDESLDKITATIASSKYVTEFWTSGQDETQAQQTDSMTSTTVEQEYEEQFDNL